MQVLFHQSKPKQKNFTFERDIFVAVFFQVLIFELTSGTWARGQFVRVLGRGCFIVDPLTTINAEFCFDPEIAFELVEMQI